MTDIRQVMVDVLNQHCRRVDYNHPGYSHCRCSFNCDEGDWAEHVVEYMQATLRNLGLIPATHICKQCGVEVFTNDSGQTWWDGPTGLLACTQGPLPVHLT